MVSGWLGTHERRRKGRTNECAWLNGQGGWVGARKEKRTDKRMRLDERVGGGVGARKHVLEPLGLGVHTHKIEIRVHHGVHGEVHGDEVQPRVAGGVGGPGEAQHGHVVVPVEEKRGGEGGKE